jgi:putative phage-type endonuclease
MALQTCSDLRVRAGSKRWAQLRNTGIGASEIASVLGIAPPSWGSPMALYMRKRGELPDVRDNARMEWGRLLEATILARFLKCHPEFREGPHLTGRLYRSNEREWQLATPDAVVFDKRPGFALDRKPYKRTIDGWPVVIEVKTGSSKDEWGQEGTDEIPVYYRAQVMQSMDVVGATVAWVPVLFNGREYREYRVERDPLDTDILRARGGAFWRMVQEGTPPPVDSLLATGKALKVAWGVEEGVQVQVPADLVEKHRRAARVAAAAERLESKYENQIRLLLASAEVGMCGTERVAKRSTWKQSRVDLEGLRRDHPELVEKYTTKEPRQRLNIHSPKETE